MSARHFLAIEGLTRAEIESFLAAAARHVAGAQSPPRPLAGKLIALVFFEDSTRTRSSFEVAAKALGAEVLDWTARGASVSKGESLVDTLRNLDAMGPAAMVLRHGASGAAELAARSVRCAVINAGDG